MIMAIKLLRAWPLIFLTEWKNGLLSYIYDGSPAFVNSKFNFNFEVLKLKVNFQI